MFFFKILSRNRYRKLLDELNNLRPQILEDQDYHQLEDKYRNLGRQKNELEKKLHRETADFKAQVEVLQQNSQELVSLQQEHQKLRDDVDLRISEQIEEGIKARGFSRSQIETLQADRLDLIELYIEKLYSLAKHFATANKEMRKNRGLFLLLVDQRNMIDENFSEFYEGQPEHLTGNQYQGIDRLAHIFSATVNDVFSYMGEKTILKDETGKITGHEERDGALLIDLKGTAFRSCMMVEGVRTHRVYSKVERLLKGSARHNAAIYASALGEVMVAIVVSEETSEVTLFRDGRFTKSYDPYTDVETLREAYVVPMKPKESLAEVIEDEALPDGPDEALPEASITEDVDVQDEDALTSPTGWESR